MKKILKILKIIPLAVAVTILSFVASKSDSGLVDVKIANADVASCESCSSCNGCSCASNCQSGSGNSPDNGGACACNGCCS